MQSSQRRPLRTSQRTGRLNGVNSSVTATVGPAYSDEPSVPIRTIPHCPWAIRTPSRWCRVLPGELVQAAVDGRVDVQDETTCPSWPRIANRRTLQNWLFDRSARMRWPSGEKASR